jgi:hypothetical protein
MFKHIYYLNSKIKILLDLLEKHHAVLHHGVTEEAGLNLHRLCPQEDAVIGGNVLARRLCSGLLLDQDQLNPNPHCLEI